MRGTTRAGMSFMPARFFDIISTQIKGVIISGRMLIPGIIPNIIAANELKISSRAWDVAGVPFGLVLMCLYLWDIGYLARRSQGSGRSFVPIPDLLSR